MLVIYNLVADGVRCGETAAIAAQIRASKRLWVGAGLDRLIRRREAEACLVEYSAAAA